MIRCLKPTLAALCWGVTMVVWAQEADHSALHRNEHALTSALSSSGALPGFPELSEAIIQRPARVHLAANAAGQPDTEL